MRTRALTGIALGFFVLGSATAQDAPTGDWRVDWTFPQFVNKGVELNFDGDGYYQSLAANPDPCAKLKSPLSELKASGDTLSFKVLRSKALSGCSDFRIEAKRESQDQFSGKAWIVNASGETPINATLTIYRKR